MMKKVLTILLIFVFAGVSHCQTTLQGTYWHNGAYFTFINSETDTTIATFTGNLHEGAACIPWKKTDNPDLFMRPNQIGNAWSDTIIYFQDSIIHKTIDGQEALLVYGKDRQLEDILLRYVGQSKNKWYEMSHGFDSVLESDIRCQIMGDYYANGQAWHISRDSIQFYSLSSLPNQPSYSSAYSIRWGETDSPEHILTLSDGRILCFILTAEGLDFYNGISHIEDNDFEWISQGDLLCHLVKTRLDNPVPGHWPEASTTLLTRGYLEPYPVEVLRLMRNEIFARHGRRFSDKKLTDFFNGEGLWYSTALLQAEKKTLSEIEQLNVQLIQSVEKRKKQNGNP